MVLLHNTRTSAGSQTPLNDCKQTCAASGSHRGYFDASLPPPSSWRAALRRFSGGFSESGWFAGARGTTKEHIPTETAAHFAYCAWHGLVATWLRTSITPPALCHATSTYILQVIQTVMQGDAQNRWHTGLCWLGSHDRQACLVYACHDSRIGLAQVLASGRWGVAWMSWFFAVVCSGMVPIMGNLFLSLLVLTPAWAWDATGLAELQAAFLIFCPS